MHPTLTSDVQTRLLVAGFGCRPTLTGNVVTMSKQQRPRPTKNDAMYLDSSDNPIAARHRKTECYCTPPN